VKERAEGHGSEKEGGVRRRRRVATRSSFGFLWSQLLVDGEVFAHFGWLFVFRSAFVYTVFAFPFFPLSSGLGSAYLRLYLSLYWNGAESGYFCGIVGCGNLFCLMFCCLQTIYSIFISISINIFILLLHLDGGGAFVFGYWRRFIDSSFFFFFFFLNNNRI